MGGEGSRLFRLLTLALMASLPAGLALAGLVALGALGAGAGLAAWAVALLATAALVHPVLDDLARMARWQDGAPDLPEPAPSLFRRELRDLIGRMRRSADTHTALRDEARAEFQRLLDALPDALFILARDSRVVRANRAARAVFGEHVVGRELALALRQPELLDAVAKALDGDATESFAVRHVGATEQVFAAHVEPLPVAAGGGPALLLVLADRTAAFKAEQTRVDFVANASHEIRSPLATIVGFIETLRGPAKDDDAARERFLGIMAEQAARMTQLVQDLLSLSRIELNEHTAPSGQVDLAATVERVRRSLAWDAGRKAMTITLTAEADLPAVRGDGDELEQVCHNLIGNSIKYGDGGSTIAVTLSRVDRPPPGARWSEGEAVTLAVRDRSPGIAREHVPRLTERFYRVDPARSRQLGGTGLGLAIVKHIVSRHRGALTIESTPGEGSVFTVYLPVMS